MTFLVTPIIVYAGILDFFGTRVSASDKKESTGNHYNSQTVPLLEPVNNPDPHITSEKNPVNIVDGVALAMETGPGYDASTVRQGSDQISVHVIREDETLSDIADMFGVTVNTIRWANNLTAKASVSEGDKLIILPITGVKHEVKKGDTPASIAKKYHGDETEILQFNGIEDEAELAVGMNIIIPNGEVSAPAPLKKSTPKKSSGATTYSGYYMRPIAGGHRSQGIHGHNGVDLAASVGTPIYASAAGTVIISKTGGYNGGYGNYIVIRHDNGTQTLYAHNTENYVGVGETVSQGQTIGTVGSTGRSTGAHVHFEVRGAKNPF